MLPTVALVGPPNSGKSTLLNKIAGQMLAVTSPIAGTTRDRQFVEVVWSGKSFTLVDTAGLDFLGSGILEESVRKQIETARQEANVLVLVVDGKQPLAALDPKVVKLFRSSKIPVCLAINKTDSPKTRGEKLVSFAKLGIKHVFPVSALTGSGIGDLLDWVSAHTKAPLREKPPVGIAVSILGKPNVGKSSLLNAILGEERVVVSPIAGTTRTAIDTPVEIAGKPYTFIDTAGLKRKNRFLDEPEKFSGFQALKSVHRSDVCLLVVDASVPLTHQDQAVGQLIAEAGRGRVLVATKADLYHGTKKQIEDYVRHFFPSWRFVPFVLVSNPDQTGIEELLEAIISVAGSQHAQISAEELNDILAWTLKHNPPRRLKDEKIPKVKSLKQVDTNPPTFVLYVNKPAAITREYTRFLAKQLALRLGLAGTEIKISLKPFLAKG